MPDEKKYAKTKALMERSAVLKAELIAEIIKAQANRRTSRAMRTEMIRFYYTLRNKDGSMVARFSDRETAIDFAKGLGLVCTVMMPNGQLAEIHDREIGGSEQNLESTRALVPTGEISIDAAIDAAGARVPLVPTLP